jgi:hypothetical protein
MPGTMRGLSGKTAWFLVPAPALLSDNWKGRTSLKIELLINLVAGENSLFWWFSGLILQVHPTYTTIYQLFSHMLYFIYSSIYICIYIYIQYRRITISRSGEAASRIMGPSAPSEAASVLPRATLPKGCKKRTCTRNFRYR